MIIDLIKDFFFLFISAIKKFILAFISVVALTDVPDKVDEYIQAYVGMDRFSGVVLVAKDGKVLFRKAYGMANYERNIRNAPESKFCIASCSKQFTAIAIMQLHDKGLLHVDDPITKYMPTDYSNQDKSNVQKDGVAVRICHLLNHTSGIVDYEGLIDMKELNRCKTTEDVIEKFKGFPLKFEPGEKFKYSSSGYVLLTYIIERVSTQTYSKYLQDNIFEPLEMKNSVAPNQEDQVKNLAKGYMFEVERNVFLENTNEFEKYLPLGDGNIFSNVDDLYLWNKALSGKTLVDKKLITEESLRQVFAPGKGEYGFGWFITKEFGRKVLSHGGTVSGYRSFMSQYLDDERVCIIVLSNLDDAPEKKINRDLSKIAFGEGYELPKQPVPIDLDVECLKYYVGIYKHKESDHKIVVGLENEKLYIKESIDTEKKIFIFPEKTTQFFIPRSDDVIIFEKNVDYTNFILKSDYEDDFVASKMPESETTG